MKRMPFFGAVLVLPALAFGWGAGHDTVARAVAERLPAPWPERLAGAALTTFCVDNHYPDARTDFAANKRVTPGEVAYLAARKMTNSGQFHSDEGRAVAFTLLVRALRENRPDSALLWLAALAHSTADMAACNHDPIVHLATYGWSDPDWAFKTPSGKTLGALDLGWMETVPEAKAVWEKNLARVVSADSGQGAEDALLTVMLDGLRGVETCAPYGVPLLRSAAAWTNSGTPADANALAESFSVLGCWAVARVLDDFRMAERLAKAGTVPEVTEQVRKRYRAAFEAFTRSRRFGDDSLTRGLTTPPKPDAPYLAVLAEPTWRMNDGMLGFNDRVLAAQTTATLREKGKNAALMDIRAFMANGVSAAQVPVVIVFAQKTSAYYTLRPEALSKQLTAYRRAGGKMVWIGGNVPDRTLCDFPQKFVCRADVGKGYPYCWTRLPVGTNAYATLSLEICGYSRRKLAHNPSFRAGWHIPSSTTFFRPESDTAVIPLAWLFDGDRSMPVGGAWPKVSPEVAYLPTYAVYPYLWTDEAPSLVPFKLQLDSQGTEALETALAALRVKTETE